MRRVPSVRDGCRCVAERCSLARSGARGRSVRRAPHSRDGCRLETRSAIVRPGPMAGPRSALARSRGSAGRSAPGIAPSRQPSPDRRDHRRLRRNRTAPDRRAASAAGRAIRRRCRSGPALPGPARQRPFRSPAAGDAAVTRRLRPAEPPPERLPHFYMTGSRGAIPIQAPAPAQGPDPAGCERLALPAPRRRPSRAGLRQRRLPDAALQPVRLLRGRPDARVRPGADADGRGPGTRPPTTPPSRRLAERGPVRDPPGAGSDAGPAPRARRSAARRSAARSSRARTARAASWPSPGRRSGPPGCAPARRPSRISCQLPRAPPDRRPARRRGHVRPARAATRSRPRTACRAASATRPSSSS